MYSRGNKTFCVLVLLIPQISPSFNRCIITSSARHDVLLLLANYTPAERYIAIDQCTAHTPPRSHAIFLLKIMVVVNMDDLWPTKRIP